MPTAHARKHGRVSASMTRWGSRLGLGAAVGILGGMAAAFLELLIHFGSEHLIGQFTHLGGNQFLTFNWAILLMPVGGALVAALLVRWLCPEAHGHGVETLTRAFHQGGGVMPAKGPLIKGSSAALVISSGGSAGPEGPIAAMGAALGSWLAQLLRLRARERRILLVAGCAAGIGAIFRCPLGGAMFATSVLYSEPEFDSDSIVPAFVASVVGYSLYISLWGYQDPLLPGISQLRFVQAWDLPWYAVLGPLCGVTGIFLYFCMNRVEALVAKRSPLPTWGNAALGGLATGALACLAPQIMDARFVFIQNTLAGQMLHATGGPGVWQWVFLLAAIVGIKCIATACTLGTGAPGGVLGPSVFIGGVVGATLGALGQALLPDWCPEELRQALIPVGMAGVLAGTMRTPLAAIVMVTEMTGSYGLIAPLMLVCVTSYVVGRRWGLNHEQVPTAGDSPAHVADPVLHFLSSISIREVMQRQWDMTVTPDTGLDEIVTKLEPGTRPVVAVAKDGQLLGVISATDIGHVLVGEGVAAILVASDVMTTQLVTVDVDDDLESALATFTRTDHEVLPVRDRRDGDRWVGMLVRRDIVEDLHRRFGESHSHIFREHASLAAIERELQIDHLLVGVSQSRAQMQRLFVPMQAVGKSLRESDFRRQFNVQVVAIELPDGTVQCPPNLDQPLRTEHRLLAVVSPPTPPAAEKPAESTTPRSSI